MSISATRTLAGGKDYLRRVTDAGLVDLLTDYLAATGLTDTEDVG